MLIHTFTLPRRLAAAVLTVADRVRPFRLWLFPKPIEPTIVYAENYTGDMYSEKVGTVHRYTQAHDRIQGASLDEVSSRNLLRKIASGMPSPQACETASSSARRTNTEIVPAPRLMVEVQGIFACSGPFRAGFSSPGPGFRASRIRPTAIAAAGRAPRRRRRVQRWCASKAEVVGVEAGQLPDSTR
ncbi:Scr1 family TA system antitoxin-like transcriptional regulator [Nocardia sp. NBC_00403]|uniref:Scr1 family TA system antitoxin-like transcriptional regulator n=1 Tax=Nocardia sp. NBC_00403 TaxID=2975990 RepID=UPI003FA591AE